MSIFALVTGDRVAEIFTTRPTVHDSLEVVDVSAYSGVAVGWYRQNDGTFAVTAPITALTDDNRNALLLRVDRGATSARNAYTTAGEYQAYTYQQKQFEAAKRLGASPPADNATNYPYLSASIGNEINPDTGTPFTTVLQVATKVQNQLAQQTLAFAAIEGLRLQGKAGVRAATTYAAAIAAATINWPTPA
jgi:hypothetical protein